MTSTRTPTTRRLRTLLGLAALLAGLTGCGESHGPQVLKLGHTLDPAHPVHQGMLVMAERLADLSGGQMRLDIYASGQLGSERQMIELLQIGSLAMTKVSTSPLEGFVPALSIFSYPYIFRDEAHYWRVLKSPLGRDLLAAGERVRLRGLTYYDAGSRSFYSVNKPIHTPADLRGMKIRVQESQTAMGMVSAMGGSPTPIAWGELYTALQQGVVDGAENNPPSFYRSKHYEVARYYTLDQHTFVPDMLVISSHVWHSLDAQQQAWLQQAADESADAQRQLWAVATEEALAEVEKSGVTIIRPSLTDFAHQVADMHESLRQSELAPLFTAIQQM